MANIHLAEAAVKVSRPPCSALILSLARACWSVRCRPACCMVSVALLPLAQSNVCHLQLLLTLPSHLFVLITLDSWAWTAACVCCPSACATGPLPPPSGCVAWQLAIVCARSCTRTAYFVCILRPPLRLLPSVHRSSSRKHPIVPGHSLPNSSSRRAPRSWRTQWRRCWAHLWPRAATPPRWPSCRWERSWGWGAGVVQQLWCTQSELLRVHVLQSLAGLA